MLLQNTVMKIQKSNPISAFGGMNFVLDHLTKSSLDRLLDDSLPSLAPQSKYSWNDILYSLLSIYLCGGDCIEDLQTHLRGHFTNNPYLSMPSSDTVLRRIGSLSAPTNTCKTKRGSVLHAYNTNSVLERLNIKLLERLGAFRQEELVLDYDNTIIFNEKKDSKMTYKRAPGYQPGVCTINENQVLYIENRNGNSDAKSFQADTLSRLFDLLGASGVCKADHFRADAASYQHDVVRLLHKKVKHFYIGCRNGYVEKYFRDVKSWAATFDTDNSAIEVGEVMVTPFERQAKNDNQAPREYRLVVKRSLKSTKQIDAFTNDAYQYRAILTNNFTLDAVELAEFYNHRGNMERQFDILKNDFGWGSMPFSDLGKNTAFLYLTAICRNLYCHIIEYFSAKCKTLRPSYRVKKFLFRFIILPSKWVERSRQKQLRVYGDIHFET